MGLESASFISDLIASNPENGDLVKEGDNHIRLLKAVLQATFINADTAIYFDKIATALTANTTIINQADGGKVIPCDADSAAFTVTLPASPSDRMRLTLYKKEFSFNVVTIAGNGKTINGESSITLSRGYQKVILTYSADLGEWYADIPYYPPIGSFLASPNDLIPGYVPAAVSGTGGVTTLSSSGGVGTFKGNKYKGLYQYCWATYSDTVCPVVTGRGVSANADWAASKYLQLPNMRGRTLMNEGADSVVLNTLQGSNTLTIVRQHLPVVNLIGNSVLSSGAGTGAIGTNSLVSVIAGTSSGIKGGSTLFPPNCGYTVTPLNDSAQQAAVIRNANLGIRWHMAY